MVAQRRRSICLEEPSKDLINLLRGPFLNAQRGATSKTDLTRVNLGHHDRLPSRKHVCDPTDEELEGLVG